MTETASASPVSAVHGLVWTACMAALITVGAFLVIPTPLMPFSMQPLFVFLTGFLLGPVNGAMAVMLYWLAGIAGLPVFSGGSSGAMHFFGPTGGFLLGFLLCTMATGMASQRRKAEDEPVSGPISMFLWGLLGLVVLYVPGVLWLKTWCGPDATIMEPITIMLPFFGADLVKLGAAVAAYRFLLSRRLAPR